MKYLRILSAVATTPWAIEPGKGEAIIAFLLFAAAGGVRSDAELDAIVKPTATDKERGSLRIEGRTANDPGAAPGGSIAVMRLHGVISPRVHDVEDTSTGGGVSAEGFQRAFRALVADSNVGGIIIDVDSPGGAVFGVPELAAEIRAARTTKPVVAVASPIAASAAYWLASQAGEFVVAPSGEVGSIGVYIYHEDLSARLDKFGVKPTLIKSGPNKAETHPAFPLSREAREHLQERSDAYYAEFIDAVAAGRGVKADAVTETFGGGRMVGATDAVRLGMVDRVGTLDEEIQRMAARLAKPSNTNAQRRRALALR